MLSSSSESALRILVAQCLLTCCGTATSSVLRENHTLVCSEILKALGTTHILSSSSSASFHFVSLSLRTLSVIFNKVSPIPSEIVLDSVEAISSWIYHRPGLLGTPAGSGTPRGRVTTEATFSFGAMSAFMPPSPQKTRKNRGAAGVEANSRSRSRSSARDESSGESEDGGGKAERRCVALFFSFILGFELNVIPSLGTTLFKSD